MRWILIYLGKDAEFHESIKWDVEQNYFSLKTIEICAYGRFPCLQLKGPLTKMMIKNLWKRII